MDTTTLTVEDFMRALLWMAQQAGWFFLGYYFGKLFILYFSKRLNPHIIQFIDEVEDDLDSLFLASMMVVSYTLIISMIRFATQVTLLFFETKTYLKERVLILLGILVVFSRWALYYVSSDNIANTFYVIGIIASLALIYFYYYGDSKTELRPEGLPIKPSWERNGGIYRGRGRGRRVWAAPRPGPRPPVEFAGRALPVDGFTQPVFREPNQPFWREQNPNGATIL